MIVEIWVEFLISGYLSHNIFEDSNPLCSISHCHYWEIVYPLWVISLFSLSFSFFFFFLWLSLFFSVKRRGIACWRQGVMGKCFSFRVIKTVFHMDRRESMERKMVKKQDRRNTWWLRSRRLLRTWEYSGWMSFKENLNQQGWKNCLD